MKNWMFRFLSMRSFFWTVVCTMTSQVIWHDQSFIKFTALNVALNFVLRGVYVISERVDSWMLHARRMSA